MSNPIVIVPGTAMWGGIFEEMRWHLGKVFGQEKIFIVPLTVLDWIGVPPSPERSTVRVMQRLHETVLEAQKRYPNEPISIIGHSGGGTAAMIYLLGKPFQGEVYPEVPVRQLITLGSPFQSVEQYGKIKSDFIAQHLNQQFFARINVVSVAGKTRFGNPKGSLAERTAFECYKNTIGCGSVWGDGVVPTQACWLDGATNLEVHNVEHLPTPFRLWYGSQSVIKIWQESLKI